MKNSLLFTALLLAIASSDVMAQTVSESEARDKALSFISQSHRARGNAANDIELAYTSATESETHYYVPLEKHLSTNCHAQNLHFLQKSNTFAP